ncbi:nuclease (plasmid) [Pseudorhodobacter turbinis]|uniref:Nuclease n=1 Tax=Pseudorhodobacter turbinis TaxID=2500533 RepID=A0A4P8EM53_9RHOB|nr:ParB N-terminal domain-containing protein [Pseudorhodobacter turbinis]QCO58167.1 nuclease [Pseudorhodobacter turbinis]
MAKRKRLTPANPDFLGAAPETKSMGPLGGMRAPIADVASQASATAALEELSREMQAARQAGRMITALPLSQIRLDHLVRDRVASDDDDMATLMASLRDRGQQAPIEVVALGQGEYGLISGWRRCTALAKLHSEGVGDGTVLAIERRPDDASDAYLAMVEENEIRVGLSYFERARIAVKSVEQGVFETEKQALLHLFRSASRAKRSKIRSFLGVVRALDGALRYPQAIGERLGLQLSAALDQDADLGPRLCQNLTNSAPQGTEAELKILADAVAPNVKTGSVKAKTVTEEPFSTHIPRSGLTVRVHKGDGRVEISGAALTPDLRARLLLWLETPTS